MRLRRTALPSAFLMLQPNRLKSRPFGRTKTVNSRLDLRRPALYTASYSTRRNNRQARGSPSPGSSDAREAMTSLFAALRKDLPPTLALHALTKAVLFVTAAHMRLKSAFRQESSPLSWSQTIAPGYRSFLRRAWHAGQMLNACYVLAMFMLMIRAQTPASINRSSGGDFALLVRRSRATGAHRRTKRNKQCSRARRQGQETVRACAKQATDRGPDLGF
jgi:hypothetical protein